LVFLCSFFFIVVCPFVLFHLAIVLSVLQFTGSAYPFDIFKRFCVVFCRSLFVRLSFFLWPLCCLFFIDLQVLTTPLVSRNSSFYN
jgi:hypothetical protein